MIKNDKRFVAQMPINYAPTTNQIRMVKDLLEHMTKRKTLMSHTTYFISKWHRGPMSYYDINDNQSPIFLPLLWPPKKKFILSTKQNIA